MRLTYWQKLGRGWKMLIDLWVVMFLWQLLVLVAFFPCYVLQVFLDDPVLTFGLSQGAALTLQICGFVVGLAWAALVGPVILYRLTQSWGTPWNYLSKQGPANAPETAPPDPSGRRAELAAPADGPSSSL
jgi:hypothetical protein